MSRYWSDIQLDRATPPQVADVRGKAILRSLDSAIADRPISDFYVRDPETCPAAALPALIAEYSMEEFIEPGLPEHVVRRILKNAWLLQSLKGYDVGVKLGLSLLGLTAGIRQWHTMVPKGPPNTHVVHFSIDEFIYPDGQDFLEPRQIAAAKHMINATKRFSQGSEIRVGVDAASNAFAGAFGGVFLVCEARAVIPSAPVVEVVAGWVALPTTHIHAEIGE